MGHAIHFLERLERLSMPQADFALALYRDPGLVRYVLEHITLPDGVERVALALEDRPDTPHIIVARDGGFVTCLGKDMGTGDHVVVPRERLDRLSAAHEALQQAIGRVSDTGSARQLFKRLCRAGRNLSREDFRTLRALYPLYWREYFETMFDLAESLHAFRGQYRRTRYARKSAAALEILQAYWQSTWALGHLVALFGTMLRELLDKIGPRIGPAGLRDFRFSFLTVHTISTPMILRGAWAVARAGQHLLPAYKELFEEPGDFMSVFDATVALTAIGLRHRRLRGEVRKILARRRNPMFDPANRHMDARKLEAVIPMYEQVLEQDELNRVAHRVYGADMLIRGTAHLPEDHPDRCRTIDDVPEELAYVLPVQIDTHLLRDVDAQVLLPAMLPWLMSVDIDEIYLPAEALGKIGLPMNPDQVLDQLDDYANYTLKAVPIRRRAKPGRNEPCTCGSGKKYKRCCGAAA